MARVRMRNPAVVLPGAVEALQALGRVGVSGGGVPMKTIGLVQLRASMINGWVHAGFVKKSGDTFERINAVATWRDAPFFTEAERAALALTDAITRLHDQTDPVPDEIWAEATRHYSEKQLASLVICIANMNAWNRVNVATRQVAGEILATDTLRSADGTSITVDHRGSGPAVVMVDGALCFRAFGPSAGLAPLLAAEGLTVYTYDRRGRGESGDTGLYAVEREIEDLQAVVDAAGDGDVGIYGMSSGAVLALRAVASGVTGIGKLALWEPPLATGEDIRPALDELIAADRKGDAVELFQTTIGVPEDTRTMMRQSPFWRALEAVAPTARYDLTVTADVSADDFRSVTQPAIVIDTATNDRLHKDALRLADALPNAEYRAVGAAGVGRPLTADLLTVLADYFTH
jgi:pimeloyl-ACP methyl ester carboxylesterase